MQTTAVVTSGKTVIVPRRLTNVTYGPPFDKLKGIRLGQKKCIKQKITPGQAPLQIVQGMPTMY
jgi:hypothetical protein